MSELKVNKITPKSGTSIQLGESGDTITIPAGATFTNNGTATGFGLSFCTTVKTSPFTATANKGFFINTGSAVTVTLPASPSTGDELIIIDQTGQAATNKITLGRNGSKIKGVCNNAEMTTNRGGLRLVYSGSSQGWITATAGNDETASQNIVASGGTETTSGDYKIHTFNSDATFTVTAVNPAVSFSYLVVAGGGGGGGSRTCYNGAGGGGAGGFREGKCSSDPYTDSPLDAGSGITLTPGAYPITVGAGGAGGQNYPQPGLGVNGNNSIFSTIISAGGGGGGSGQGSVPSPTTDGGDGGSGGGKKHGASAGSGNTPPVSPPQGNNGGATTPPTNASSGGGGATAVGGTGGPGCSTIGAGGAGATTSISGSPVVRASGGGGATYNGCGASATPGGGGAGGPVGGPSGNRDGGAGTANTGGGGGGSGSSSTPGPRCGGAGGSGVVIIRYKYQ